MNDVTDYLDLSFDRAIIFPIFLLKFNDQNVQNQGKLFYCEFKTIYNLPVFSYFRFSCSLNPLNLTELLP